jgi:hypothetical protein
MAVSEDLLNRLIKLALKHTHGDTGILLLYRQGVLWVDRIISLLGETTGKQITPDVFPLVLQCPLGQLNDETSTQFSLVCTM